MYRRILIGGVTAAAVIGAGGTALALSGSHTTSGTPVTSVAAKHTKAGNHALRDRRLLRHVVHGQIVVNGKNGFVTHDVIVGTVTAVSPTSITVRAADNTSETYVVDSATKVRQRTPTSRGASSIGQVHAGDQVLVAGTGTTTFTARHIVDIKH
ncbi:MAG TPA: hypothetical protein VKB75_16620 [Jatrophihabitans sp.]|nr:hypothetical protein [Jatrophihabitans sp.]